MVSSNSRLPLLFLTFLILLLTSCAPATIPSAQVQVPNAATTANSDTKAFTPVDGSRALIFPEDFGAHEDFRTEWWYYTGNLQTQDNRHFGFELTIFRVSLIPPTVPLPTDSKWYNHSLYFAHFAVTDIKNKKFYAFERYSRPGPGLAGAQANPYHVWLEDWNITQQLPSVYSLQATQGQIAIDLTLTDEMGVVLHGKDGYSRKGENPTDASYYYSQPRLQAEGTIQVNGVQSAVTGLAWNDHEFSSGGLEKNQVGWDWFSLQFENGPALMLFQLRQRGGGISSTSSGTFISAPGKPQALQRDDFDISVLEQWQSPHTKAAYPSAWKIQLKQPNCALEIHPWMTDQEINFSEVTYWEGAVHFEGTCNHAPVHGNGYIELTGYTGNLPLR
jgi:predicted secreted hydrolase